MLAAFLTQATGIFALFAVAVAAIMALYVWLIVHEAMNPPRGGLAFALARRLPTTPEELGLASRTFTVACEGSRPGSGTPPILIPVWEVSRDAAAVDDTTPTNSRPRIVLLHGWGRSRIDSLGRINPFLFDNAVVYLPELRGHGDATSDARSRTTLGTREARDLDELIATLPPGPVILVGHSLGATIAIRTAAEGFEKQRVQGVIAIAPYDTLTTPIAGRLAARDLPRGLPLTLAMAALRMRGIDPPSALDAVRSLAVPLLILQGRLDRVSPASEAKAIAEAGRGEYVELPDAEHADHHIRHPEQFEAVIRAFLRRVLG